MYGDRAKPTSNIQIASLSCERNESAKCQVAEKRNRLRFSAGVQWRCADFQLRTNEQKRTGRLPRALSLCGRRAWSDAPRAF
jgi:hypothetical protein